MRKRVEGWRTCRARELGIYLYLRARSTCSSALSVLCFGSLKLFECKNGKRKEVGVLLELDFPLVQDRPEGFSTARKQSNSKLCSLATLVFSASHLPRLLRSTNFFLTLRTFSHNIPFLQSYIRSG